MTHLVLFRIVGLYLGLPIAVDALLVSMFMTLRVFPTQIPEYHPLHRHPLRPLPSGIIVLVIYADLVCPP
jgi:hypothetical protein